MIFIQKSLYCQFFGAFPKICTHSSKILTRALHALQFEKPFVWYVRFATHPVLSISKMAELLTGPGTQKNIVKIFSLNSIVPLAWITKPTTDFRFWNLLNYFFEKWVIKQSMYWHWLINTSMGDCSKVSKKQ